jgi:hypothetical protein
MKTKMKARTTKHEVPAGSPPSRPGAESTTWKTADTDADADRRGAGQAEISFRHFKKIDGDYDNDNRSAYAPLTTSELEANKGRGGDVAPTEH